MRKPWRRTPPGTVLISLSLAALSRMLESDDVAALARDKAAERRLPAHAWQGAREVDRDLWSDVELDVDLDEVLDALEPEQIVALAEAKGLVVLVPARMQDAADRLRWRDVPGALMHLGYALPRSFCGFADDLARQFRAGAA